MRLVAALVIALLPAAALGQTQTTGSDPGTSGTTSYGGGSAYGGGSYSGPSIDTPTASEPDGTRATQPNLGGNYGYGDRSRSRQTR
jgi:hypothetical protein